MNLQIQCPCCGSGVMDLPVPPPCWVTCPWCGKEFAYPPVQAMRPTTSEGVWTALGLLLVFVGVMGGLGSLALLWIADRPWLGGSGRSAAGTWRLIGGLLSTVDLAAAGVCFIRAGDRPAAVAGKAIFVGLGLAVSGVCGWIVVFGSCKYW